MSTIINTKQKTNIFDAKGIAQIGVLTAIATVLMLFEFPLWFAPGFYKIDLSDVPILIGSFAIGPLAGLIMEFIKNLLNLMINGTTTGGIGELSNFVIGCALVLPSAVIYKQQKTKKGAVIGLITGTVCLILAGCLLNAYVLLPVYAKVFHMPMDALVAMGTAINPNIKSLSALIILAVAPFNLLKGVLASVLTLLIYKKVSPILHK
ncbi:MAG TPA: ECF transporter S component [Caproiciproducens sp.]|nr:ECF transporter S component [Caproiciproducens sp.]